VSRVAFGAKLTKDVKRAGGCYHKIHYQLVDKEGNLVGNHSWIVEGRHNADQDCIFTDTDLLTRLARQLEMAQISIYQESGADDEAVKQVQQGKVKTLDEVLGNLK
jgi:hypothetical protein